MVLAVEVLCTVGTYLWSPHWSTLTSHQDIRSIAYLGSARLVPCDSSAANFNAGQHLPNSVGTWSNKRDGTKQAPNLVQGPCNSSTQSFTPQTASRLASVAPFAGHGDNNHLQGQLR